ncbi:DUF3987 domain-containing protein [Kaistella sp.]|uniref:DUF3987 domain-containing protein n=1 Tax=Kaistella sp. TaxID=2782235 RepID=UPI002F91DDA0
MEATYKFFAEEEVRHNVTLFRKFTEIVKHVTIQDCIDEIRNGCYKKQVEEIRKINAEKGKEEADKLKKNLTAFTPSGTFENGRKINAISEYNQCVILDYDDISPDYLQEAKDRATLAPYTLAAFISPRGTGLKIIVQVDSDVCNHGLAFQQVADYYAQVLNEEVDPSGKDCSRLCFMSYDPEAYYNSDAEVFKVTQEIALPKESVPAKTDEEIFNGIVEFTNQKATYTNGSRNAYIHLLACNCNRHGLSQSFAETKILSTFDLDPREITATVNSAYKHNENEHQKFAGIANIADLAEFANTTATLDEDVLKSMPFIPDEVYQHLPTILKEGALAFAEDHRKRDVFLTSALTVISGCLPEVVGIYHQERVFPNLFCFIIAPAANGKGVMKNAKRLAEKYHCKIKEQSEAEKEEYRKELLRYKAICAKLKKGEEPPEQPVEPPYKRVFIPADTSQSMLIKMINDNGGNGIMFETEADTMAGANKQDWGSYSPLLRGAFHHEPISIARKTNNEVFEIKEPKIAVCLSGTPAQVPRLIGSAENGLFSRFMFYAFRSPIVWQSPAPAANGIVYNDHFDKLAAELLEATELLVNYPTEVQFTPVQWTRFNREFTDHLEQSVLYNSDDIAGVVYRLGLITFRICMVFTALRKVEDGDTANTVFCTDEDFTAAILLSKVYIQHSIMIFNSLSDAEAEENFKPATNKEKLIPLLPETFSRKQAVEEGAKLSLSTRTVDALLQKLVPSMLEKIKDGFYKKRN